MRAALERYVGMLGRLVSVLAPWTEPLVRVTSGLSLAAHGFPKLFVDPVRTAAFFEEIGFVPGLLWTYLVGATEFVGGLCLALGLLTRVVAFPILIFLLTAVVFHWPNGFYWNLDGFEFPLFWAVVTFHFLVHGGGRISLDRRLGIPF